MNNQNIYFALSQSTLVHSRSVKLDDIATVFSNENDVLNNARNIQIIKLDEQNDQQVITALYIVKKITELYKNATITSIGENETIIYYKNVKTPKKILNNIKIILVMLLAFFGTAYSIMSYNGDVGTDQLLEKIYYQFMGAEADFNSNLSLVGLVGYSIGLFIGMIVLFNHGITSKKQYEPTPLQVQMRLYEGEVNQCIIVDSERKEKTIDVD